MKFRVWDEIFETLDDSTLWSITTDGTIYYGDDEYPRAKIELFTGLLDKNGKEIYEGDIYSYDNPNFGYGGDDPEYLKDTIKSIEELYFDDIIQWRLSDCEVIGNIHEKGGL